jgi:DNA polymerase III subunit delta'
MPFKNILGHDKVIELLRQYMLGNRLASAYLFTGPQAIGKRTVAVEFAKALNCETDKFEACGECLTCQKIAQNNHPDLHFIPSLFDLLEKKSEAIKIEEIRALRRIVSLKPYEAKKSVTIIDDAHNLNQASSNALLKTLEETPRHSLIILITHKPSLLARTIISRCQVLRFFALPRLELVRILKSDYGVAADLAHFVSFFSEGRLGFALRIKDTDILNEKNRIIDQLCLGNSYYVHAASFENRVNFRDCLNIIVSWFRDLYLIKAGVADCQIINLDRKQELFSQVLRHSILDIELKLKFVSDALQYLEYNVNTKLLLSNLRAVMKG